MIIHIAYGVIILVLVLILAVVWMAHVKNGQALLRVNCVAAEMLLDEARYNAIRKTFIDFMEDQRQPLNQQPPGRGDYEADRTYWLSSAFQIEKVTQVLLINECHNEYEGLAHAVHRYVEQKKSLGNGAA